MTISHAGRKQKGNRAEREVLEFLRERLGDSIVRARGEGAQDHGDIAGLQVAVQVKSYQDVTRAIREGLAGVAEQKQHAGLGMGCVFVRRRGGKYVVCMDAEDWVSLYREATL